MRVFLPCRSLPDVKENHLGNSPLLNTSTVSERTNLHARLIRIKPKSSGSRRQLREYGIHLCVQLRERAIVHDSKVSERHDAEYIHPARRFVAPLDFFLRHPGSKIDVAGVRAAQNGAFVAQLLIGVYLEKLRTMMQKTRLSGCADRFNHRVFPFIKSPQQEIDRYIEMSIIMTAQAML